MTRKLPKSVRKFLRRQKAELRRSINDPKLLDRALWELAAKFFGNDHERQAD
ncbi:MAG: hypothetical protein V1846_00125 [Candidatus Komeilibacteria bacterium]